jgi:hypothetical protein
MRRLLAITTLIAALSASACSGDNDQPAAAPASTAPSPTRAGPSLSPSDYQSELACRLAGEAKAGSPDAEAIARAASASSVPGIKLAGDVLADRQARSVALAGTDQEDGATALVDDGVDRVRQACIAAGLSEP